MDTFYLTSEDTDIKVDFKGSKYIIYGYSYDYESEKMTCQIKVDSKTKGAQAC